ncbi:MAG: dTDP-4-dehydrorhamnose reductase, partial [Caldisphaera sp.]
GIVFNDEEKIYNLSGSYIICGYMKILVTGAAGMLADSLVPELKEREHEVLATDINTATGCDYLDVRDYKNFLKIANEFEPDLICHLAAETDVDKCQMQPDHAFETNTIGTYNAAIIAKKLRIKLLYVSTAGVFDGNKSEPYTEFDKPNPINIYGLSKLMGEEYVKNMVDEFYIVRAGWMMGGREKDKKFVHKILEQIKTGTKDIYAVVDKFGTPTYAPSFSKVVSELIETEFYGVYHISCKNVASRFDVAKEILRILGKTDIKLHPVDSTYFKDKYFAPRPKSEAMRNYMLELRKLDTMPTWQDALKEYLSELNIDLV